MTKKHDPVIEYYPNYIPNDGMQKWFLCEAKRLKTQLFEAVQWISEMNKKYPDSDTEFHVIIWLGSDAPDGDGWMFNINVLTEVNIEIDSVSELMVGQVLFPEFKSTTVADGLLVRETVLDVLREAQSKK